MNFAPDQAFPALPRSTDLAVLYRLLVLVVAALVTGIGAVWLHDSEPLIFLGCSLGLIVLVVVYKFDYLHPAVAYLVPWLTILLFSTMPISEYARSLQFSTACFLLATIFVWMLVTAGSPIAVGKLPSPTAAPGALAGEPITRRVKLGLIGGFGILYVLALVNVAFAGYVPLISLLTSGDSRYLEFGIPSVYGAFLAYANAVACLAMYVYLRTRARLFLLLLFSVLVLHVLFVTRQNIITLLVEIFVIRCLVIARLSRTMIIALVIVGLTAFSALGDLRSNGVRDAVRVTATFDWIPNSVVWLYAYSYFNVLNVENMIELSGAPHYDGSMWDNLLPSVLRPPEVDSDSYVEVAMAAASSYIYPIYNDVGPVGVLLATGFWGLVTARVHRRALRERRFVDVATYGCLYFCALLSFFVDFWFYLPVVFQIVFFWMLHMFLFRPAPRSGVRHE